MGFLLGAYGKQMAGKRVRSLQARMIRVQSELRRAARDIEQREKYWARVEKDTKNSIQQQSSYMTMAFSQGLQASVFNQIEGLTDQQRENLAQGKWDGIDATTAGRITEAMRQINTQNAQVTQAMQASLQQTLALQEQQIEMQKEADMQPLKDLEDELQTEKDSLESQIQIAEKDYELCQNIEKSGVKYLTPQYTGQG